MRREVTYHLYHVYVFNHVRRPSKIYRIRVQTSRPAINNEQTTPSKFYPATVYNNNIPCAYSVRYRPVRIAVIFRRGPTPAASPSSQLSAQCRTAAAVELIL